MIRSIVLVGALISSSAFAGDNGGGQLDCQSTSGRTVVSGMAGVDYNGYGYAKIEYKIDSSTVNLNAAAPLADGVYLYDAVKFSHGQSYSLVMNKIWSHTDKYDGEKYVYRDDIFTLRNSTKLKAVAGAPDRFSFKAVIPANTSVDPRLTPNLAGEIEKFGQDIEVNCILDVSL